MVIQRDAPSTFWGWSSPNTNVTAVLFNEATNQSLTSSSVSSSTDGLWSVTFPPQPASGFTWKLLAVTSEVDLMRCLEFQFYCGGASLTLYPLAFGDVVQCIGQSNSAYFFFAWLFFPRSPRSGIAYQTPTPTPSPLCFFPHAHPFAVQVNVAFAFNASAELVDSAALAGVLRFFQVSASVTAKDSPLEDFAVPASIPWTAPTASANSPLGGFSATCYFTAKSLILGRPPASRSIPLGLISAPWGGTSIKAHAPPSVNATCAPLYPGGNFGCGMDHAPCNASEIYNAMLAPLSGVASQLTAFPVAAFIWFQGENDAELVGESLAWYTCMLGGLASSLRAAHSSPGAHWTTIQLAPYTGGAALGPFRDMQCNATDTTIPNSHCAILLDDGDVLSPIGTVHSRNKQLVGERVAVGLLEALYGIPHPTHGRGPVWAGQELHTGAPSPSNGTVTLTALVSFAAEGLGGQGLVYTPPHATPYTNSSRCPSELGIIKASDCAWPSIVGSDGKVYQGEAEAVGGGQQLLITVNGVPKGVSAVGSSYSYGPWPVVNFYNAFGVPVEAWYKV